MRVSGLLLLAGIILGACAPGGTPSPESPAPVVLESLPDSMASATRPFKWSSAVFRVEVDARTTQADSAAVDSLRRQGTVRLTPDQDGSRIILAFEATGDTTTTTSSSTIRVSHLVVDSTGQVAFRELEGAPCVGRLPEISPLLIRQLVLPSDPRNFAEENRGTDSVIYVSCVQGVRVQSFIELQWTKERLQPDVRGLQFQIQITGRIQADSSRQLPMRMTGTIRGTSKVVFSESTLELIRLESVVESNLEATAGAARHQRFSQTVTYRANRDTTTGLIN